MVAMSCWGNILVAALIVGFSHNGNAYRRIRRDAACENEYPRDGAGNVHTLCLAPSSLNQNVAGVVYVSDSDKAAIIQKHNTLRSGVEPTAKNMEKAVWDDRLAHLAQAWAEQCTNGHDSNTYIKQYGESPGQNVAAGYGSWDSAIQAWYDEVTDFQYGTGSTGGVVGHYTQVVQDGVSRIGCGFATCNTLYSRHYVCNYLEQNFQIPRPYLSGATCADCPNSCDSATGLCDCNGLFCFNGGTKNIDTCTCSCPESYYGDACEKSYCPDLYCQNGGSIDKATCRCKCNWKKYIGDRCETSSAGLTCAQNRYCHTSHARCEYLGFQDSKAECAKHNGGKDHGVCGTGSFNCTGCTTYWNVKFDYCPNYCGLCSETGCSGTTCRFGGILDTNTCTCTSCPQGYSGDFCEIQPCSGQLCYNGATLDQGTCTCVCTSKRYSGADCFDENCIGYSCPVGESLNYDDCSCKTTTAPPPPTQPPAPPTQPPAPPTQPPAPPTQPPAPPTQPPAPPTQPPAPPTQPPAPPTQPPAPPTQPPAPPTQPPAPPTQPPSCQPAKKCCAGKKFSRRTSVCCGNKLFTKRRGGVFYDPDASGPRTLLRCCGSNTYATDSGQKCCDGRVYKKNQYKCCDGKLNARVSRQARCCGTDLFDRKSQICCEDSVFDKTPSTVCCGKSTINAVTQFCCDGRTFERDLLRSKICCGGELLDRQWQVTKCCHDEAYDYTNYRCVFGFVIKRFWPLF